MWPYKNAIFCVTSQDPIVGDSAVHGPDRSLGSDTDKDWAPVSDPDPDTGRDA